MVTVIEKNESIAFPSRAKAIRHYKDRTLLAYKDEDAINCRRILETLEHTDAERIIDSYGKERYILSKCSIEKQGVAMLFRLGDNEVLRIEKNFKGAGLWYDIMLHDRASDDNGRLILNDEHIICRQEVYKQQLSTVLHNIIFRKGI